MKQLAVAVCFSAGLLAAAPACATVLVSGAGWQDDEITSPGVPSMGSEWTFTIGKASVLSVVDAFIPGDVYTLSGTPTGTTTFYAGSVGDIQATGFYGDYWTDASYSKLALLLAPGTYSFSVFGDGAGGTPAGLALRLDATSVPEPASWAMMVGAFGAVGMAMRRRTRRVSIAG